MIFELYRASTGRWSDEDSPAPIDYPGVIRPSKEQPWQIELETLEELMTLMQVVGNDIVLEAPAPGQFDNGVPTLLIYDDYIE